MEIKAKPLAWGIDGAWKGWPRVLQPFPLLGFLYASHARETLARLRPAPGAQFGGRDTRIGALGQTTDLVLCWRCVPFAGLCRAGALGFSEKSARGAGERTCREFFLHVHYLYRQWSNPPISGLSLPKAWFIEPGFSRFKSGHPLLGPGTPKRGCRWADTQNGVCAGAGLTYCLSGRRSIA